MRTVITLSVLLLYECAYAASAYWSGISLISGGGNNNTSGCTLLGYGKDGSGKNVNITSSFFWHKDIDNVYIKHEDFSLEDLEPTFNWWAFAVYGDVVSEDNFNALNRIEDFYGNDVYTGGTLVDNPDDFYMAFKVSEVLVDENYYYYEGQTWYGWVHVSIDENLKMTLLGDGINLDGGAVTVGVTPEPASGLLLLVGGALLALRRRRILI